MADTFDTYTLCKAARRHVLTRAGEAMAYSWDSDFAIKNLKENYREEIMHLDPNDLTKEEMEDLDFGRWSDETEVMLIPIWMYPFLHENIHTISIGGDKHTSKSEIDTDHRFGCLAYGVIPKDKKENANEKD